MGMLETNKDTFFVPQPFSQDPEVLAQSMELTGNLEQHESYAGLHEFQGRNAVELITGLRLPFNAFPPQAILQVYSRTRVHYHVPVLHIPEQGYASNFKRVYKRNERRWEGERVSGGNGNKQNKRSSPTGNANRPHLLMTLCNQKEQHFTDSQIHSY